jgi:type III secretory pathway component EscR
MKCKKHGDLLAKDIYLVDRFYRKKDATKTHFLQKRCKICNRNSTKKNHEKNREKYKNYNKKWRTNKQNRDKEYFKKYYEKNREEIKKRTIARYRKLRAAYDELQKLTEEKS